MLATWPEKVERLISIDCWSPMSASTWSKTGSAAVSAGGRRPDWCSSAARPSVFSATVLPPVFGPLMTSARRSPRSRSIGTAASRRAADAARRAAAPRRTTSTGAPRQRRESVPRASARSIRPVASTSAERAARRSPTPAESSRRIRSTSSRSALAASDWRLFSSTTSNGSTNSVCPESEESWTMPGTLRRALALTASTGRPPRWVTKSSCRCSRSSLERASCSSSSRTRCRPVRSSPRSWRSGGEALSRRSEPSSSTARSIASASGASAGSIAAASSRSSGAGSAPSSAARARSAPATVSTTCLQRLRREHAAARRVRRGLANVANPFERRLGRVVEQRDRLGRQRLPARDLVGVGRRLERARERGAGVGRRRAREPLHDRRKLEHVERVRVHPTECRLGDHGRHGLRRGADGLAQQVRGRRRDRARRARPPPLHLDELPGRLRLHRGDARRGRRPARRARAGRRADVPRLPHPRPPSSACST